jgi:hypothetical protein
MAEIPSGTKFIGIDASVPTPENKSSQNNAFQQVYTIEDIAGAAGGYTETIVNISSASLLASIEHTLLPAPNEGEYYDIDKVILEYSYGTSAYSGEDLISLRGCINKAIENILLYGQDRVLISSGESSSVYLNIVAESGMLAVDSISMTDNFKLNTGELTDGDGTLRVKIYHKTVTFGA